MSQHVKKTVVITWVSRGLWEAFAHKFLSEWYYVIGTYRSTIPALSHDRLRAFQSDVSNYAENTQLAKMLEEEHVTLDVLINNAWICLDFDDTTIDIRKVAQMMMVNLYGMIDLTEKCLSLMNASGNGSHILNISSMAWALGKNVVWAAMPWYRLTKVGVNMYTQSLWARLSQTDILVSAIDPWWVQTDMGWDDAPLQPSHVAERVFAHSQRRDIATWRFWREWRERDW